MIRSVIIVRAIWDEEARVWVATSDDLPGLVTEAKTQEKLLAKLRSLIPDLLEDDEATRDDLPEVPLIIVSEQFAKIRLRA